MEEWLMMLNSDLGEYICKNWSKVKIGEEYGYMARIEPKVGLFVGLDQRISVVGLMGKDPTTRQMRKMWKKLIKENWATPIAIDAYAPFGVEFETQLPFVIDDDVVEFEEKDNGD